MKALWFTVAVLATALAMALAAFPAMGETIPPELQAYSQQLQQYYQQQFQSKMAEAQKSLQAQGATPQQMQDQLKVFQEQLQKQFQDDYAKQMAQAQKQLQEHQQAQPPAAAQTQPAPAQAAPQSAPAKTEPEGPAFLGHNLKSTRLSLQGVTPLLMKNSYDSMFKSFGPLFLVSFPVGALNHRGYFHGELGLGAMFSRFVGSSGGFNHTYLEVPVRLRLLYPLSASIVGEVYAGALLRPYEYSDNPSLSKSSLFPNRAGIFAPDFGLGLTIPLASTFRTRITFGLASLAVGFEWGLD